MPWTTPSAKPTQFDIATRDPESGRWVFLRSARGTSGQSVRQRFLAKETDYAPGDVRVFRHKPLTPAQRQALATSRAQAAASTAAAYGKLRGSQAERASASANAVKLSNEIRDALAALGWRFKQGGTQGDVMAHEFAETMYFGNDRKGGSLSLTLHPNFHD